MNLVRKAIAILFALIVTIAIALSPQIINKLILAEAVSAPAWATVLINVSWIAFLATFVLPTTYFVTYAMLGRTVRRYRNSASAIAAPIVTAIVGVLIIYFLQSAIVTLIAYTLIALSAVALALVIINNERAYYRPPTILSLANDGDLPLVSVVIPAHNEDGTVSQAIESVLDQTYPRTEVIVVDDGSTDNTAEIASGYAERYPDRVKIVKHEKNLGKFEALNSGMDEARGELIYHMDADGYLAPDNIERMVSAFNDEKIGAAASMVAISNDRNALTRLQQIEYFFEQLIVRFS